ncbi:hypothetical protein [Holospora elegans]|uniref:hypothetical protein n=1 Tax=Holospora elegans TaxID=431043 RepID=UPI00139F2999|nr:hypothetical protein [Holospora elegans]
MAVGGAETTGAVEVGGAETTGAVEVGGNEEVELLVFKEVRCVDAGVEVKD